MFDQVILRHDKDGRGRSNDELTELVTQGIQQVKAGVEPIVISDETEAIKHALDIAQPGSFIVYCADKVFEIIDFVQELLSKYNGSNISLVNSEKKAV
jgi:cyanophycin synthetase